MRKMRNSEGRRQKMMSILFLAVIIVSYLATLNWLQHRTINRVQNIDIIDGRN